MTNRPKIAIFYDGNYLLHCSNYYNYIHCQHKRISISGLHRFVCDIIARSYNDSVDPLTINSAHYFRGRLGAADALSRGNQLYNDRVFDDILMAEGIETHYLPLRGVGTRREESGTTVALALKAQELALAGLMDIAVLVVADTDYVPLLRTLRTRGVQTMVVGWEFEYINDEGVRMTTRTSAEIQNIATYALSMHEIIEQGLQDNNPLIEDLFVCTPEPRTAPVQSTETLTSTVLSIKNGFGFIRYPNNNLFFHSADVVNCDFTDLQVGDTVEFEIGLSEQGQQVARSVRRIEEQL